MFTTASAFLLAAFLAAQPTGKPPKDAPAADPGDAKTTKLTHPIITEVLYAVPSGDDGDANGDGKRSSTGDEFVELFNPHDKPINLRGYAITDKSDGKPGSLKFVFPSCTLQPGQCAVLFNGFECSWKGPVGDAVSAPKEGHTDFGGAMVFSMKETSGKIALANGGDCVILAAPDGTKLELIKWGKVEKHPTAQSVQEAPTTNRASVQRSSPTGKFLVHEDDGKKRYSPGRFGKEASKAPAPKDDADKPAKKGG